MGVRIPRCGEIFTLLFYILKVFHYLHFIKWDAKWEIHKSPLPESLLSYFGDGHRDW